MPPESNAVSFKHLIAFRFQTRKIQCFHSVKYINSHVHLNNYGWTWCLITDSLKVSSPGFYIELTYYFEVMFYIYLYICIPPKHGGVYVVHEWMCTTDGVVMHFGWQVFVHLDTNESHFHWNKAVLCTYILGEKSFSFQIRTNSIAEYFSLICIYW